MTMHPNLGYTPEILAEREVLLDQISASFRKLIQLEASRIRSVGPTRSDLQVVLEYAASLVASDAAMTVRGRVLYDHLYKSGALDAGFSETPSKTELSMFMRQYAITCGLMSDLLRPILGPNWLTHTHEINYQYIGVRK